MWTGTEPALLEEASADIAVNIGPVHGAVDTEPPPLHTAVAVRFFCFQSHFLYVLCYEDNHRISVQLNISHQDVFLLSVLSVRNIIKSVIICSSCSFPPDMYEIIFLRVYGTHLQ